jgi:hypothetical protein
VTPEEEPRSLTVLRGITDDHKCVFRHKYDDLPKRVKGTLVFETVKDNQDHFTPQTGYYTNNKEARVAVELLQDEDRDNT